MTRFLLAAGVAALAISAPAASAPGGGKGEQRKAAAVQQQRGGGGGGGRAAEFRGGGQMRMQAAARGGGARFQAQQRAEVRAQPQRQAAVQRRAEAQQRRTEQRAAIQERRGRVDRQAQIQRQAQVQKQARIDRRANQQRTERQAQIQQQRTQRQAQIQQQRTQRQAQIQQQRTQRQAQIQQRQAIAQQRAQTRNQQAMARAEAQKFGRNNNPVVAGRARNLAPVAAVGAGVAAGTIAANANGYGVGGCPPGLAKKAVACMPPGQAAKLAPFATRNADAAAILAPAYAQTFVGRPLSVVSNTIPLDPLPVRLQSIYPNTPQYYYQYGDGYLYQVNRSNDLVSALLPLFGAGYGIGQPFPVGYPNYYMPTAYQPFFPQTPYYDYRYADCYTYEVDPYTGMIVDTIPTFAYGCGFGQIMPAAYSTYNVPYQYRPYYADTSDYYYRYAPGAIYQVDPNTSLITAVAALLTGGLTVGQPLPMGYSAYNVPLAYRATYYDTPTVNYRYSDGYIYSVDPVTGLVTNRVVTVV